MRPFLGVLGFEMRYYMTRISTWVFFALFFGLTMLMSALVNGAFDSLSGSVGGAGGVVHANAPYVLAQLMSFFGIVSVLVVMAVSGNAIYRDFGAGIHSLFFTTPVPKSSFLAGRFTGAVLTNLVILTSIPLALALGTYMPWVDPLKLGPFRLDAYVAPFLVKIVPNVLFTSAIFFGLASVTRQMLPNYLGGVALLIGYLASGRLLQDLENKTLAALLDPFGSAASSVTTEYWTAAEKNTLLTPVMGVVGVNRLIWIAAALVIFATCAWRFRFAHAANERPGLLRWPWRAPAVAEPEGRGLKAGMRLELPAVTRHFSFRAQWTQFVTTFRRSFLGIVANVYFPAIAGGGFLFLLLVSGGVGKIYGTPTWPVTYEVLDLLGGTYGIFIVIIVTFFAGELVWQERDLKVNQVIDSLPAPSWTSLAGKSLALFAVVACLQLVVLVAGVVLQAYRGYFKFELGLYLSVLLGLSLAGYLLYVVLAMLIHVLVNHKYLGHLLVVLVYVGIALGFLSRFGFEHQLYQYGEGSGYTYSDMNGFGAFLGPWSVFKLYWAAVAVLLALGANLLWVRGMETAFGKRLQMARDRLSRPVLVTGVAALVAVVALGSFIFYNTNILNKYRTTHQGEEAQARYERTYKKYEHLAQPRIIGVKVDTDLHPSTGAAEFRGTYSLVNKTQEPISELHVILPTEAEIGKLEFTPEATLDPKDVDEEVGYRIYRLKEPLSPGAPLECRFELAYRRKGFTNSGPDTTVLDNGTFVNSQLLPSFGYSRGGELGEDDTRRRLDLPPRERMAKVDDPVGRRNTYISHDSDWVSFETTVSTDTDQIALAPGYLEKEWTENGRHYFHYVMDRPILWFCSWVSARWEVKRDKWNDVSLEVYYHPGHEYNVDRMIDGMKKSLDYYTREFGPYQHHQVRILEFPRLVGSFAQSFPNTIPFSEAIGFIARLDEESNIDFPFYVTAHEVAHQWWAHQVIGGDVQGSTLMSETLAQYSALMVMEKEYGPQKMRRFLKYELDQYLQGRSFERKKELPLALCENQPYIHYRKGSVVFYALRDYLGEETLNGVIRDYLARVKYQEPPYTNSLELVDMIRAAAPPELKGFVDDQLMKITLYDLRAKEATAKKRPDGKWDVTLTYEAKQMQADETGNESEVPLDVPIEVGVFTEGLGTKEDDDVPLVFEKRVIANGPGTLTFTVDKKPNRAGLDPYHVLVDRQPSDNLVRVKEADAGAS